MEVFKDPINNRLAIILGEVIFISNLEGLIYKHTQIEKFDSETFTEETEFPIDFEEAEASYWDDKNDDLSIKKSLLHKEDLSKKEKTNEYVPVRNGLDFGMAF